jgi:CO/xanthine dehydrogenase FAD-binding subunit
MVGGFIPNNLGEALEIRAAKKVIPYAGGTELMVKEEAAGDYLFLHRLPELKELSADNGHIRIGSGCTFAELLESDIAPPLLKEAVGGIAAPAIRNLGTIGGNICNASPAGDTLPPLYLYDAAIVLASLDPNSNTADKKIIERRLPIADFILGVRKTALKDNEILTAIEIPLSSFTHTAYQKVGARKAQAISKLSFAAAARIENGEIKDFRAAFGAVGITVVRRRDLEKHITGQKAAAVHPEETRARYEPVLKPIDDQRSSGEYRKQVCLNLLADFLESVSL